ncbi:MAG: YciI family protein [Planctomycetota bacterium]|nr:YciI family protein [Planctomycetota bacterium]MEC8513027.1 YciI family protein [Planctomycetota bacterium]
MSIRSLSGLLALSVLSAACSSTSASVEVAPELSAFDVATQQGEAYCMVIMRKGAAADHIDLNELGEITQAHLDFNAKMIEEGMLLVSGPVVAPRAERDMRSICILDTADTREAYARACTDPACETGMLRCEVLPFVCEDNLRAMPGMERGMRMERGVDQVYARPYVMVQMPSSAATDAVIELMGDAALFSGCCTGGEYEGMTFVACNARTVSDARDMMGTIVNHPEEFVYHPWISTQALKQMN